jgi:hypothetical protein
VLDSCRIRWGTVVVVAEETITVEVRHLTWDGRALGLGEPVVEVVQHGGSAATAGTLVALHWDRFCDVLTAEQVADLERTTLRELAATNLRLAT